MQPILFLWHGHALVLGPVQGVVGHRHFACQLSLSLGLPLEIRFDAAADWVSTLACVIAPHDEHHLRSDQCLAHLFVDAAQDLNRLPRASMLVEKLDDRWLSMLGQLRGVDHTSTITQVEEISAVWKELALPRTVSAPAIDTRIVQAQSVLRELALDGDEHSWAKQLSAQIGMSATRLTHLFRAQTGMSMTRHVLWLRLLAAVEAIATGASLTDAAQTAGFADLAHMSRSFKACFGVTPSTLQKMTIVFKR